MSSRTSAFCPQVLLAALLSAFFVPGTAQAQPGMAKWEHWLNITYAGVERAYPLDCMPGSTAHEDETLDEARRYRVQYACVHNDVKVSIVDSTAGAVALTTTLPYFRKRGHAPVEVESKGFKVELALVKM